MEDLIFIVVFTGSASILLNLLNNFKFRNQYFIQKLDMSTQTDEDELEQHHEEEYIEPEILPPVKQKTKGIFW